MEGAILQFRPAARSTGRGSKLGTRIGPIHPHMEASMGILVSWLILSIAVWLTATILPGVHLKSARSALLVAAIFGVLNFLLGWLFFAILTIATLGLAWLLAFITRVVINAILLKFTDALTDHLKIDSFKWALGAAVMMSAIGTVGQWLVRGGM
jgi:putative membrane protein